MTFRLAANYDQARTWFRAAAGEAGATLGQWRRNDLVGVDGEDLTIDVAAFGPDDPRATLIVLAGTHGVEGYAGSALQLELIGKGSVRSDAVRVVLVHALNPYGFSYHSRTDENNVDLNRNFVTRFPGPNNPQYDDWLGIVEPGEWRLADLDAVPLRVIDDPAGCQQAIQRGQYHRPGGLFFGGSDAAWSRIQFQKIIVQEARGAFVGLIDIHTGLGESGAGEIMYTGKTSDAAYAHARAMLFDEPVACPGATQSVSAEVEGTLVSALPRLLPGIDIAPVTLEFGVREFWPTLHALRGDAWLRRTGRENLVAAEAVRKAARHVFLDESEKWCSSVARRGRSIVERAITNLAQT